MSEPLGWRNTRNSYEVLDSSPDKGEASRLMFQYAERLKRKRVTKRFGVKLEKRRNVWLVVLVDRETQKLRGKGEQSE